MISASSLAVVQARMSSSRLPGKTLAQIGGEPALALLLKRLQRASACAGIVVATSLEPIDDPIAALAVSLGAGLARGSRDDVLDRFIVALDGHDGPAIRITADCPLIDPGIVDATVELYLSTPGCAYASNVDPRTFPDGLDVEVVSTDVLRAIASTPLSVAEREHVTLAIRDDPRRFPSASLVHAEDLGDLRWTVDEPVDLEFVRALVGRLGTRRYAAGLQEILTAVRQQPSLQKFGGYRRG